MRQKKGEEIYRKVAEDRSNCSHNALVCLNEARFDAKKVESGEQ